MATPAEGKEHVEQTGTGSAPCGTRSLGARHHCSDSIHAGRSRRGGEGDPRHHDEKAVGVGTDLTCTARLAAPLNRKRFVTKACHL